MGAIVTVRTNPGQDVEQMKREIQKALSQFGETVTVNVSASKSQSNYTQVGAPEQQPKNKYLGQ